jgi:DNA polymerase
MNITKELKEEIIDILNKKKLFGMKHIKPINFHHEKIAKITLPNNTKDLKTHVENCFLCELYKSKEFVLFDRGDYNCKIHIIGLNYDFYDDKEYLLIKNMIEKVLEININDIYMTNVIKCITKKKLSSYDDEVEKCIHYLEKQLSISKPEVIITLGKAFNYMMTSDEDIMNVSGNLFSYNGVTIIPLMEPSFINKNPSYKEKMFLDLKKIKNILDKK